MESAVSSEVERNRVVPAGIKPGYMKCYYEHCQGFTRWMIVVFVLTEDGGIAHAQSFARLPCVAASRSIMAVPGEAPTSASTTPTQIM